MSERYLAPNHGLSGRVHTLTFQAEGTGNCLGLHGDVIAIAGADHERIRRSGSGGEPGVHEQRVLPIPSEQSHPRHFADSFFLALR